MPMNFRRFYAASKSELTNGGICIRTALGGYGALMLRESEHDCLLGVSRLVLLYIGTHHPGLPHRPSHPYGR